jgi:ATP/maltotriose-dependent transcriptional regulator MalT
MHDQRHIVRGSASEVSLVLDNSGRSILTEDEWLWMRDELGLSARELEVLQCIFDDQVEAGMALGLGISVHTIHSHMKRMYRKLDVCSRTAAILRVFAEYAGHNARASRRSRSGSGS